VDGNSSFIIPNSSLFLQQEEDARREKVLSEMGLRVIRFRNEEVLKDLSAVVAKIRGLVV
jgi:very-short-patch-repair endonuclease